MLFDQSAPKASPELPTAQEFDLTLTCTVPAVWHQQTRLSGYPWSAEAKAPAALRWSATQIPAQPIWACAREGGNEYNAPKHWMHAHGVMRMHEGKEGNQTSDANCHLNGAAYVCHIIP